MNVAAVALSAAAVMPAQAEVEGLSANVGAVSDYYFRGVNLGDAGAYAGIDYEAAGFYVGAWVIDDGGAVPDATPGGDGLEYDMYLGWAMETESGFGLNLGYTRYDYTYTSDFEHELNLGLSMSGFALDVAVGQDDDDNGQDPVDYLFAGLSWSGDVFGATIGHWELDSELDNEYNYIELSAGGEVATLDMAVSIGRNFGIKGNGADVGSTGTEYIVLDISKSFSF